MKYLIFSDIHGSSYYANKIIKLKEKEKPNKVIILGDIYNHGPKNPLPKDYNPLKTAELLNSIKKDLIVIKGNCDSEVDTLISDFDFINSMCLCVENKTVFLSHGHIYNKDNLPKTNFDIIIYGHFHTGFIEKQNNIIVANAGSISLPKDNENSFIILEDNKLSLVNVDGKIIKELYF